MAAYSQVCRHASRGNGKQQVSNGSVHHECDVQEQVPQQHSSFQLENPSAITWGSQGTSGHPLTSSLEIGKLSF